MKFLNLIALSLIVLLSACDSESEQPPYDFFRRKLTPDRQHYIYWYSRPGPMAFSSNTYGMQIMRLDEPFKERGGLTFKGSVDYWIGKDTLVIRSYSKSEKAHSAKDTLPIKVDYQQYDNIIVKHIYEHASTGGGTNKFKFDSVSVANGIITFWGTDATVNFSNAIDKQIGKNAFNYPLGAILVETNRGMINKIEFSRAYKTMNFTRLDERGKTLYHQPEFGNDYYEFTPTHNIKAKTLGDIGVFYDHALAQKPNNKAGR